MTTNTPVGTNGRPGRSRTPASTLVGDALSMVAMFVVFAGALATYLALETIPEVGATAALAVGFALAFALSLGVAWIAHWLARLERRRRRSRRFGARPDPSARIPRR